MEKVREALDFARSNGMEWHDYQAALAEVEEWEARFAESKEPWALARWAARAEAAEDALRALVEQVEMDESVGICLSDRVAALNALQVLTR
jgi:hypothetical protein